MKIKNLLILPLAAALAFGLASCSDDKGAGDAGADAGKVDDYPLDVCVVSGEKLGSMGDPIVYDHEGTTVKFCCDSCIPKFKKDPDAYLAKLKASE